jgi:hypothetical protein
MPTAKVNTQDFGMNKGEIIGPTARAVEPATFLR